MPEPVDEGAEQAGRGSSPNWGAPILYVLLLAGAASHRGSWWGVLWQVLYFAMIVFGAYSTFSPKELADEQRRRPGTTRRDHYLTTGIPYVLVPLVGWVGAIWFRLPYGALIPAVPWIILLLIGAVMIARER